MEIDYGTNTIVIQESISWSDGDEVSLPYAGSAPDIGAFEYYEASPAIELDPDFIGRGGVAYAESGSASTPLDSVDSAGVDSSVNRRGQNDSEAILPSGSERIETWQVAIGVGLMVSGIFIATLFLARRTTDKSS